MNRSIFTLVIVITCLAAAGHSHGQSREMYSWTDENGVVHFTDERPQGQEVTVHEIPDSDDQPVSSPYDQADMPDVPSLAQQKREAMAQRREEAEAARAVNEANCATMRAQLEKLEPNRRVFYTNEEGEVERMDDVHRADSIAQAQEYIDQNCK